MNKTNTIIKDLIKQSGFNASQIGHVAFKDYAAIYRLSNPTAKTIQKIKDAIKTLKNKKK